MELDDIGMIDDGLVDVTHKQGDRCGVCSEGFLKQCVYFVGHKEKLHKFASRDVAWPPIYLDQELTGETY